MDYKPRKLRCSERLLCDFPRVHPVCAVGSREMMPSGIRLSYGRIRSIQGRVSSFYTPMYSLYDHVRFKLSTCNPGLCTVVYGRHSTLRICVFGRKRLYWDRDDVYLGGLFGFISPHKTPQSVQVLLAAMHRHVIAGARLIEYACATLAHQVSLRSTPT